MKKTALIITVIMILSLFAPMTAMDEAAAAGKTVSIAFTSDIHSHLDESHGSGGLARVGTLINEIEDAHKDTFLLDAGNFSMGTVFQTVYRRRAAELKMLGTMKYDAVALGASEFEYGASGLADMLDSAAADKKTTKTTTQKWNKLTYKYETNTTFSRTMPEVVCSNVNWKKSYGNKEKAAQVRSLQQAWNAYDVVDYTIVKKGGVKMAVVSALGDSAKASAGATGLYFKEQQSRIKNLVKEIKTNKEADMIVCLAPDSGNNSQVALEESQHLAKAVPDLDVIICGQGLKGMKEPVKEGNTAIVGVAGNTTEVGHLLMKKQGDSYAVKDFENIAVKDNVKRNAPIYSEVKKVASQVTSDYLRSQGYSYSQTLARNNISFTEINKLPSTTGEDTLGNLVSDSYIRAVKSAEGRNSKGVDVAVVSMDNIRAGLPKGNVTATDAYDINGAGIGRDRTAGYPLVTAYVTGKELKRIAEANASLAGEDGRARIFVSGMKFSFNSHRLYLNKAFDMEIDKGNGKTEKIQNGKLYRVVTGWSELRSLEDLDNVAFGLMKIEPKNSAGKVVTNYDRLVLKNGSKEVKTWKAVADYINSMRGGKISAAYGKTQGRIQDLTGFNPISLLKDPNYMGIILLAGILIVVVIILAILLVLRRRVYNRRGFGKRVFKPKKRRGSRAFKKRPMGFSRGRKRRRF